MCYLFLKIRLRESVVLDALKFLLQPLRRLLLSPQLRQVLKFSPPLQQQVTMTSVLVKIYKICVAEFELMSFLK